MGRMKVTPVQKAGVLLLRAFAPLAVLYTAYRVGVALAVAFFMTYVPRLLMSLRLPLGLEVVIFLEVGFLLHQWLRHRVMSRRRSSPELTRADLETIIERCVAHTRDMKAMISGWFLDVPFDQLSTEDVQKFVAWMLYSKYPHEINDGEEQELVELGVRRIEAAAGHRLLTRGEGEREHFCMRHTLDPLRHKHRPMLVYLVFHVLFNFVVGRATLRALGFRRMHAGHVWYWYRPASSSPAVKRRRGGRKWWRARREGWKGKGVEGVSESDSTVAQPEQQHHHNQDEASNSSSGQMPLVFVHGIGIGLLMYAGLLRAMVRDVDTDIFLVELPHAALQLHEFVPSHTQAVQSMLTMLSRHGYHRAVFSGHSLGSVYLSWMSRYAPQAVAASVFVEPIVFMLYLKSVTRNFLYEEYGGAVGYLIRSELHLNHALRRHFWWAVNILWLEDVNHPCHVFLTDGDEVVPTDEVVHYLRTHSNSHYVTFEVMDTEYHGRWLLDARRTAHISNAIRRAWLQASQSPCDMALNTNGADVESVVVEMELTEREGFGTKDDRRQIIWKTEEHGTEHGNPLHQIAAVA